MEYDFKAEIWLYDGQAAWHFVTLPKDISNEIKENFGSSRRGFGSVRVKVKIGTTEWKTSIFPDTKLGAYLLPIKKEVRFSEGLSVGDKASLIVNIDL